MPGQIRAYMISEVVGTDPWTTLEEKAQAEQVSSSRHCPLILLPLRPQGHRRVVLDGSPEQSGCASAHPPPQEVVALLALAHHWSTLFTTRGSKCWSKQLHPAEICTTLDGTMAGHIKGSLREDKQVASSKSKCFSTFTFVKNLCNILYRHAFSF